MMPQVIIDKTGDEKVAVVRGFLHAHFQRVMCADAGLLEAAWFQLFAKEVII